MNRCFQNRLLLWPAVALILPTASVYAETGDWWLMSRDGTCTEIASLERKVPGAAQLHSPQEVVELLRSQGYSVALDEFPELEGFAVGLSVPDLGLDLTFAKPPYCSN